MIFGAARVGNMDGMVDCVGVGLVVGLVGATDGFAEEFLGVALGQVLGSIVGSAVRTIEGILEGALNVGSAEGFGVIVTVVGASVIGLSVFGKVGVEVAVGNDVGEAEASTKGFFVGAKIGFDVGAFDDAIVGFFVGIDKGGGVALIDGPVVDVVGRVVEG